MTFSSSMSVVEYYLLKRFPVPYGITIQCLFFEKHEKIFLLLLSFRLRLFHFMLEEYKLGCDFLPVAAIYLIGVATVAAFIGQHVVRKLIILMGRASLIIFILAFTIFVSAISLGNSLSLSLYRVACDILLP